MEPQAGYDEAGGAVPGSGAQLSRVALNARTGRALRSPRRGGALTKPGASPVAAGMPIVAGAAGASIPRGPGGARQQQGPRAPLRSACVPGEASVGDNVGAGGNSGDAASPRAASLASARRGGEGGPSGVQGAADGACAAEAAACSVSTAPAGSAGSGDAPHGGGGGSGGADTGAGSASTVLVRSPAAAKLMRMAEAEHKNRASRFGMSGRLRRSAALMKNSKNLRFRELYRADDATLNAFVLMVVFLLVWLAHTRSWPFEGLPR